MGKKNALTAERTLRKEFTANFTPDFHSVHEYRENGMAGNIFAMRIG
jgi:hypothetical protein